MGLYFRYFSGGDELDEEEGPSLKDTAMRHGFRLANILCVWDCASIWIRTSELFAMIVFDPFTELFITICIIVNVLFMALDHYNVDYDDNGGM